MNELNAIEARVLGVLIEKAQTTPAQYPLTLNGLVSGCNQRNNRDPVTSYDEDDVLDAIDRLRAKNFVREVMLSGSRVAKYRHIAREGLELDTRELAVLAELLMRGPQTVGELRSRASRMTTLESTDVVQNILDQLMQRDPPLARRVAPAPGSRAQRFAQLLSPDLHPIDGPSQSGPAAPTAPAAPSTAAGAAPDRELAQRIDAMEQEIATLREQIDALHEHLGLAARSPTGSPPPSGPPSAPPSASTAD